ncbi:MAG: hypothetical protein ABSE16_11400 [Verrucomicrobiota bacterium]|jgi:hypothetical protein
MNTDGREILILRQLSSSDLGWFAELRNKGLVVSKQRAINFNADIITEILPPDIVGRGEVMINAKCIHPGAPGEESRILKKVGKNWRLGGRKVKGDVFLRTKPGDFFLARLRIPPQPPYEMDWTVIAQDLDQENHSKMSTHFGSRLSGRMTFLEGDDTNAIELSNLLAAQLDPTPSYVQFSESNGMWQPLPHWVRFFIDFGFNLPRDAVGPQRIALILMPCDSAVSGLITLGAMIRDLGRQDANETEGHYDALLRYAQQYLECCRHCDLDPCDPSIRRCGFAERASGRLRSPLCPRETFQISDRTDFQNRQIAWHYRSGRNTTGICWPDPQYAVNWHVDGDPAQQILCGEGVLPGEPYKALVEGAAIYDPNLHASYSGLCFAGRVAGSSVTRDMCASLRFRAGSVVHTLNDLLTVHGWSGAPLSRVSFFNSHTSKLDRYSSSPVLVVADGDSAFLKCLARREFQNSNVIGVVHWALERDKLEALGNKMIDLRQWYEPDEELLTRMVAPPRGVSMTILKRRAA